MRIRLQTRDAIVLGTIATIAGAVWFWTATHQLNEALLILCPGAAFTAMLCLGSDRVLERLQFWIHDNPSRVIIIPASLWLFYLLYATGMGILESRAALAMAIYLTIPFLAFGLSRNLEPLVILWLWLPLELGIIRNLLITHRTGPDAHYVFAQLLAFDAGILAFAVWNTTPAIGYRFEISRKITSTGVIQFLLFAAIAIPLGLAIGFIRYTFTTSKLYPAPLSFLGIFFFTALPEEFLFRGLIQNWIERTTKNQAFSLIAAALIFGASHLNNGPPLPNYKYFLMASVAGIFYGRAWRSTGSLMSSSLTHALVDTIWSVLFR
jgi:CAAX protease family protein